MDRISKILFLGTLGGICTIGIALGIIFLIPVAVFDVEDTTIFDDYVQSQMRQHNVPQVGFAIVTNTDIVYQRNFQLDDETALPSDVVFQIASLSKPLTAWGVMALVEAGTIDLDAEVNSYLADWQIPNSEFREPVTVRRLLSHTSGIGVSDGYEGFLLTEQPQTLLESLEGAADNPENEAVRVVNEPGSAFVYSGGGYSVLQLLIEDVSGMTFEDYMRETVFDALMMENTGYALDDDLIARMAPVYDETGTVAALRQHTALAAGGAYATLEDVALWVQATLADENSVLSQATLQQMFEQQPEATLDFGLSFGLGYHVDQLLRTEQAYIWHDGNNVSGWHTYLGILPEQNIGVVVLSNSPGGKALRENVACAWVQSVAVDVSADCFSHNLPRSLALGLIGAVVMIWLGIKGKRARAVAKT